MRKFIITAELRDITDKWDNQQTRPEDSISYSRMVEILNEKALQYAKDYAKELEGSKWVSVDSGVEDLRKVLKKLENHIDGKLGIICSDIPLFHDDILNAINKITPQQKQ
jgi:hypothetical protein